MLWSSIGSAVGASFTLSTCRVKSLCASRPPLSVAVTLICSVPTWPLSGVPLNNPSSKINQPGRRSPDCFVAENVKVLSPSGSVNVPSGRRKENAASCVAICLSMGVVLTSGGLLNASTWMIKLSEAESGSTGSLSVAFRERVMVPMSSVLGVPLNVKVSLSNVSQLALPGAFPENVWLSMVYVRTSFASGSWNIVGGSSHSNGTPVLAVMPGPTGMFKTGASLISVTCMEKMPETARSNVSVAVTLISKVPTSPLFGVPLKVPVSGLKSSQSGRVVVPTWLAVQVRRSPFCVSMSVKA